MRIIASLTHPTTVRDILVHLGELTAPPRIAPARGPPRRGLPDVAVDTFYSHVQPAPKYEFDHRIAW